MGSRAARGARDGSDGLGSTGELLWPDLARVVPIAEHRGPSERPRRLAADEDGKALAGDRERSEGKVRQLVEGTRERLVAPGEEVPPQPDRLVEIRASPREPVALSEVLVLGGVIPDTHPDDETAARECVESR